MEENGKSIREKTLGLRFVLSLVFGYVFVGCLIYLVTELLGYFIEGNESVSYYDGEDFARILTAIIIFGGLHFWLSASVKKGEGEFATLPKYQRVLSIIYSASWAVVGLVGAWMAISEPMGLALGFSDGEGLGRIVADGIVLLVFSGVVIVEQMRLVPKMPKNLYILLMSGVSVVTIVLFLIFPAGVIRDVGYDDKIESDLYEIEDGIEEYYDEKGRLPNSLSELDARYEDRMNFSYELYEYERTGYAAYQLCAEFRLSTLDSYSESFYLNSSYFYRHDEGRYCFKRSMSGRSAYSGRGYYDDAPDEEFEVKPMVVEEGA